MNSGRYKQKLSHFSRVAGILLVLILFLFSCPALAKNNKSRDTSETIRVGCEIDYPPYCFVNDQGKADGFSADLFLAAANKMGLDIEFVTGPWNKLKYDLAKGKIDALPLVGRTPERESMYDFTFPYLEMHGTIVVREGEKSIHSIEDLVGKEVAVMKGDNAEEYLQRINLDAQIIQRTTFKKALKELSRGKHDAVVIQRLTALKLMQEHGIRNLKLVGDPTKIFKQSFCFAVKEGNNELQSLLNEGLSIINTNGTFRRLHAQWFAPIEASSAPKKRIIIAGDSNYPPYEYLDKNGNPAGYNVDLTRAIAKEMGMKIEIRLGPWSKVRKELKEGNIDALQGMLYSPERDRTFDLSPAHTNISYIIAGRKDKELPENLEALKGESVAVQEGDLMHDHVEKYNFTEKVTIVNSQEEALKLLLRGEINYALTSKILTHYYIEKNNWDNLKMSKNPVLSAKYCIGVMEGNTELLSRLTEGLSAIKSKGEYRKIYSEWFGAYEEKDIRFRDVLKYSLFILIPLLIILAGSILWWYTLKKEVRKKTNELQRENWARKRAEDRIKNLYQLLKSRNEEIAAQNEEYQTLNEELREKNESLITVNKELKEAKNKAQESDNLKSAFLANLSHEIRTPMNGIMGFTDLLKNAQLNGEKKDEYINLIQNSGERMLNIINNLLDIARIESGQIETNITETYVNEVLFEVTALLKLEADKKGLSLEMSKGLTDEESLVMTDPALLNQILVNLLNNAIKYTKQGKIKLNYKKEKDVLHFYITDTGIGISYDYQKKIFERFRQADDTITKPYEGAGLGLSISKAYVNILGGEMWVDSTPGKGSTFHFTLPYKPPERNTINLNKIDSFSKEKKLPTDLTILVAEDDKNSFLLLKEILGNDKINYIHAEDGLKAVEKVKENQEIDIILMDIKMPKMDGYKATREIKKIDQSLLIIAQTAFASPQDKQKAINAGCDEYISKPISRNKLLDIILKLLRDRKS